MENIHNELKELYQKIEEQISSQKEFLDLDEASRYMRLSKSALYKLTSKGKLRYYQPGGKKIYFRRTDLHEWIENGEKDSLNGLRSEVESHLSRNINDLEL